jgi:hypothetical protein
MKRILQLRLSSLLAVITVSMLPIYFFLPFTPNVSFQNPEMAFSSDNAGTGFPEVSVTLKNNGRLPIWYRGGESDIREFVIQGDLTKGERHVHSPHSSTQMSWNSLSPGETTILPIPAYELFDNARVQVEFCDWRSRSVMCTSPEYDFSSVPVDGVPGMGVKPPAPIPQAR